MSRRRARCAIYTRKSHTEGLDQAFNSLDAQRQAGVDYVNSQKHEGWKVVRARYDDGGFSGGTMQRPALKRLFDDIEYGGVDVVVVYKVDRLSRALGDFAQIMQRFDDSGVSFVSVTQQFNTTNSMGRLTLNMLLSFAQFEREVTGERIRDKITASKKKGMWVCGQPPLGYRLKCDDKARKLHVVAQEARLVRTIYEEYLKTNSVLKVAEQLNAAGYTTKRWKSKAGHWRGGRRLSGPFIRRVLTNETYMGRITNGENGKTNAWPGRHDAIIDEKLWSEVHAVLETWDRQTRHRWDLPYLLKGKLRTGDDVTMSPGSVRRTSRGQNGEGTKKRLVRYYVSQKALKHGYATCPIKSINAAHLDELIRALILDYLTTISFDQLEKEHAESRDYWTREILDGVMLSPERILVRLSQDRIEECREREWPESCCPSPPVIPFCPYKPDVKERGHLTVLSLSIRIKRLGGKRIILSPEGRDLVLPANPEPREHIVNAIGLAYRWQETLLRSGGTIIDLARAESVTERSVRRLLPLTHLGPEILKGALVGTLPLSVTLNDVLAAARSLDWKRQARELGLGPQA